jgi:NAD(P)-dependent dehydrogenase (short-subunit alcohol dehydrogenase family)
MELQGKVVLVTGASSGIGKAIAIAFAQKRAQVFVHYERTRLVGRKRSERLKSFQAGDSAKPTSWIPANARRHSTADTEATTMN